MKADRWRDVNTGRFTSPILVELHLTPYTQVDPKTGKAIQNAIYDGNGNVIGHVDFKNHNPPNNSLSPNGVSGHAHIFSTPGNPASGHGKGKPHIPNQHLPSGWDSLPPNVSPHTPLGH